jgi:AcrR family transcriptional regulator
MIVCDMAQNKTESVRSRGRPRQYDPDDALESATRVFWKAGYAGTSLDDLVAETGIKRPSLNAGFGDKRDLYLKTLRRYRDQSRATAVELLADKPELRVFLRRYFEAALDIYLGGDDYARGCYSIATAGAQAAVDPAVRDFLADSIRGADAFLRDVIEAARERGEIAQDANTEALAQLATSTLHALAIRSRAGAERQQLSALASGAIDLICGPIKRGVKRP